MTPDGFLCSPWVGCRIGLPNGAVGGPWQEQWILPRIVPAGTDQSGWWQDQGLHQDRTACVCHIVEQRLAFGLFEHSLGSSGCSRKYDGSPGPPYFIWMMWANTINLRRSRLSLSVSSCSWGCSVGRPQHDQLLEDHHSRHGYRVVRRADHQGCRGQAPSGCQRLKCAS